MSIKHDYGRLLTFIVLLIVSSSTAIAQELMKVTGVVVDQNAEPLIGVTVRVKDDAKSGTVTGLDGDFSIMVQKGKTLVFSYLGYQTKEVAAITSKLKINMKEDNKMLDDVVVVGYGVQKKSSVTGAISQVKKEDMEKLWDYVLDGTLSCVVVTTLRQPMRKRTMRQRHLEGMGRSELHQYFLPMMFDMVVHQKKLSPTLIAKVMDYNPAKIFGFYGRKGALNWDSTVTL